MTSTTDTPSSPWGRLLEALAWASLLAAFIIGQIAAQTDYEALLKQAMPNVKLTRSEASKDLPVVYRMESNGKQSPDVVVMSEGVGYGGPLIVGIKARRTDEGARLNEILVLSHKETPAFMQRINQSNFFRQFAGKSVTDNFIVGDDIDAVSGATVSSEGFAAAIREAVHLGAVQHLKLPMTWQVPTWQIGTNEFILVALFALAFFGAYRRDKPAKYARLVVMVGTLAFVGFYANVSLNLGNIAGIFMGYIPSPKQHPMWWIMIIGALGSVVILGRNIYCHQICPFKVVQDLLQKISGVKLRIKPEIQRKSRALIFFLSWIALMLIFLSAHPALGSYEPFAMMFSLEGLGIQWYILPAALLGSLFVPSFWCRLFCPVGLYLNEIVRMRRAVRERLFGGGGKPPSASGKTAKTIKVEQE
jgi:Na+-translocating ferredoxin:NAD+ oxidoreductase RnfG subunit